MTMPKFYPLPGPISPVPEPRQGIETNAMRSGRFRGGRVNALMFTSFAK